MKWPITVAATLLATAAFCAGAGRADTATLAVVPPADITATADTGCNGSWCTRVAYTVGATGGYSPYHYICTLPSGGFFLAGTTNVTCWAQDSRGDTSTAGAFKITVNTPAGDPPPPPPPPPPPALSFTQPASILATANTPCGNTFCAFVNITPAATGGYPPYSFVCNLSTGYFIQGVHHDSCFAQDSEDDSTPPKSFDVTILAPPPTPLAITAPADFTVTATTPCALAFCAEVDYSYDITGGYAPYTLHCNIPSGSLLLPGTYLITCYPQDAGNELTGTQSFTVTVVAPDGAAPSGSRRGNRYHPPRQRGPGINA